MKLTEYGKKWLGVLLLIIGFLMISWLGATKYMADKLIEPEHAIIHKTTVDYETNSTP